MGRFLNADAFASTGQGILGYNMFTYCNNCSIIFIDHNGASPFPTTKLVNDGGSSGKLIYNQNDHPYNNMPLGITTISHGGCGPIAAYNAMQLMGRTDVDFESVINYFEQNNGLLLGGLIGTSLYTCANFFADQGYDVLMTRDVATYAPLTYGADSAILWYWFDVATFPYVGAHFVAFKQNVDAGAYFNAFNNSVSPFYAESADSFVSLSPGGCNPVLILIYKK